MADRLIKMRTRMQKGAVELQVLITHPMETGLRVNKNTRKKIPPHYIQKVTIELNRKTVAVADTGPCVSQDPLLVVRLKDAKTGDKIRVFWTDNLGESGSLTGSVELS